MAAARKTGLGRGRAKEEAPKAPFGSRQVSEHRPPRRPARVHIIGVYRMIT